MISWNEILLTKGKINILKGERASIEPLDDGERVFQNVLRVLQQWRGGAVGRESIVDENPFESILFLSKKKILHS